MTGASRRVARAATARGVSVVLAVSLAGAGVGAGASWSAPAWAVDKVACVSAAEAAQRLRKERKLVASREQLLMCANPDCPAVVSTDCTSWLGEVERSVASVVVLAHDGRGQLLTSVRVLADGALFMAQAPSTPVEIDPGEHVFRCEAPGFAAAEVRVTLGEGERGHIVACDMPSPVTPQVGTAPTGTLATPLATAPVGSDEPPAGTGGGIPAASWVLGGVGLVAIGAGVGLYAWQRNDQNTDESGTNCGSMSGNHLCDVSGIRTKLELSYVSFAVGAVAVGVAVVLALLHGR
jgi:hypothetical protein